VDLVVFLEGRPPLPRVRDDRDREEAMIPSHEERMRRTKGASHYAAGWIVLALFAVAAAAAILL
jgi:hypothetical protein